MANFPSSPTVGQTFTTPAGVTYTFTSDGAWKAAQGIYAFATYAELLAGTDTTKSASVRDIARFVRAQPHNYVVAGGTANALTLSLNPSISEYTLGLTLRVFTGASPNSAAMTVNVDGVGSRNLLRRSGSQMAGGDVPGSTCFEMTYDGSAFRFNGIVTSDMISGLSAAPTAPQLNFFDLTTLNTQNIPSSTITVVTDLGISSSKASDAVYSAGIITIGPNTAGVWAFGQTYVPAQVGGAPTVVQAYIQKNGNNLYNQTVTGTFCTNGGVVRVAAGDTLRMAVWQNSGNPQKNQHAPALPITTTFNLYQISS